MNYIYKEKLYTIKKIDIKDFQQYDGKWYPTVFYENEEGLRFNRSVKEFFDKFEVYRKANKIDTEKVKEAFRKMNKQPLMQPENNEPVLYSTPKSGTNGKNPKVDRYLNIGEVGFMNNIKVMPLKYTGGHPSSGACKKCEFYKNERCELFENEIDTFCTRLEREDHTTIFYKKVKDLIALVLEKMPFLDSDRFKLWFDERYIYISNEGGVHRISIIDLDYDIRINEHARRMKTHFDIKG